MTLREQGRAGGVEPEPSRLWTVDDMRIASEPRHHTSTPAQRTLATACEQRLGRMVDAAGVFDLHRLSSPAGTIKPHKPHRVVLALTDTDVWLLEPRQRLFSFSAGAALGQFPRRGLVAHWHHRRWAWPMVWKAELSWPDLATLIEGAMIAGEDADRLIGLMAADDFDRELWRAAPAQ